MREDICPPDAPIQDKFDACMERNTRLGNALHDLHSQAKSLGYETVQEAMASLAEMARLWKREYRTEHSRVEHLTAKVIELQRKPLGKPPENLDIVDQLYLLLVRRGYAQHEAHEIANGPHSESLLEAARCWIATANHGDNCFVSDHYEGDPGNQCNCGKDALLSAIELGLPQENPDIARFTWLTDDHDDPEAREKRNSILDRMPVMSYSAVCSDIDAAMAEQAARFALQIADKR